MWSSVAAVLCTIFALSMQLLQSTSATQQITRKHWVTDKIVKIQDEFQADDMFSYALCKEERERGYVNLSCGVILESFADDNSVQSRECRSDFNRSVDSLLHIRFANRDKIILTNLQQTSSSEQLAHVIRIIDVATCRSRDIAVILSHEPLEMSSVQGTKVFMRSADVFEIVYDVPGQLCDNDICRMTFNSRGEVLSEFAPITREPMPIDEDDEDDDDDVAYSVIFKYLHPLAAGDRESEYFVVALQTSGDIPLPYVSDRPVLITLLRTNSASSEVLEVLKFDCYGFDRQRFVDIDASDGYLSVCFKDYKLYGPTMMRCRQFDRNWTKILDVDRVINSNNVNAIKVKTWKRGELLLATHENEQQHQQQGSTRREQRVYVRKIESEGRGEAPIFVSEAGSSQSDPWKLDFFTNFYEDRGGGNLCLMGWHLGYIRNYFQQCEITRMCFSKRAATTDQ